MLPNIVYFLQIKIESHNYNLCIRPYFMFTYIFPYFQQPRLYEKLSMNLFLKNVKEMKHVSLIHNSTE